MSENPEFNSNNTSNNETPMFNNEEPKKSNDDSNQSSNEGPMEGGKGKKARKGNEWTRLVTKTYKKNKRSNKNYTFKQAIKDGLLPPELATLGGTWGAVHDSGELTYLNLVHLDGIDGTDPDSLTAGEIAGRRQVRQIIEAIRRYVPGCEESRLRNLGSTLGVRDTRKIVSRSDVTEAQVRGQGRVEDSIGIFPEFIDGYGVLILPTTGRYFEVPFGSMIPKGIDGLLVAGRATGGDRIAHAATRNMACCVVTGQGAGVAAALAVKQGVEPAEVSLSDLQRELERQDVRLH